jgi:outer membrane protein assembly factor BamB
MEPKTEKRVRWSKSGPYLKLPSVSSPGLDKGRLVFGDGMHQTDGATLHCLKLDGGLPLWQLPMPGKLVHLEGSPTISEGKAYIGGGAAGVVCVDLDRVSLEGKEMDLASIQKILAKRMQELQKKYDIDKKTDPFAVPPREDELPRANPRRLWQVGQEKWHVDAPANVVGDRVLICSAFLDQEKVGDRAIYCLDAKTGTSKWRKPLKLNPWGGASVDKDLVVVTGSNIGYDTKVLKKSKGMIAAFDLGGTEKWQKDVPGGVVSCAALSDGLAVVTATDGKVRAFDLATGERRWIYPGKSPFFAPPAIAKGVVYAGDLNGVLHAIDSRTGQERWTLDLGTHKDVMSPGMIYGGPVVDGGRIYVATCNVEGLHAQKTTAVVCIGD